MPQPPIEDLIDKPMAHIFVDLAYLVKCSYELSMGIIQGSDQELHAHMDYLSAIKVLHRDYKTNTIRVYDAVSSQGPSRSHQKAHNALARHPNVKLHLRNSLEPPKFEQKEVDVALALNMVQCAQRNPGDVIVLCAGDRDFVPAVEECQRLGAHIRIAMFRDTAPSKALLDCADSVHNLDEESLMFLRPFRIFTERDGEE